MERRQNATGEASGTPGSFTRRQFLSGCAALGATVAATSLTGCALGYSYTPTPEPENSNSSLKEVAGQKSLVVGAATMRCILEADPRFAEAVASHAGLLVAENELKWEWVEPLPGQFDYSLSDWLADFAARNGMAFRGHTLVWHQQTPNWAGLNVTAAVAQEQLTSHIANVVGHFAGSVHSWDIVNEAINPADGRADYLRKTRWLQALGPSYIELAFRAAAAADPHATLVYNDYGLEWDSSDGDRRRIGTYRLLAGLMAAGVPVHALGIQAHLQADRRFAETKLTDFMRQVAELGLEIFITELDVSDRYLPADVTMRDGVVANVYSDFLNTVLKQPAVSTIITWGLSDRYTWLADYEPRWDGLPVRPLPLDSAMQPKPAMWAMMNAINATEARVTPGGSSQRSLL